MLTTTILNNPVSRGGGISFPSSENPQGSIDYYSDIIRLKYYSNRVSYIGKACPEQIQSCKSKRKNGDRVNSEVHTAPVRFDLKRNFSGCDLVEEGHSYFSCPTEETAFDSDDGAVDTLNDMHDEGAGEFPKQP